MDIDGENRGMGMEEKVRIMINIIHLFHSSYIEIPHQFTYNSPLVCGIPVYDIIPIFPNSPDDSFDDDNDDNKSKANNADDLPEDRYENQVASNQNTQPAAATGDRHVVLYTNISIQS